jgi:hypothetical protein
MIRAVTPDDDFDVDVAGVAATLRQAGRPPETLLGRGDDRGGFSFPTAQVATTGQLDVTLTITRDDGTLVGTTCAWTVAPPPPAPPPGLPTTPWGPLLQAVAEGLALALAGALGTKLLMGRLRRAVAGIR